MNKTALKNFAIAARLELLQRVMNRANLYGVNEETCKSRSFAPSSGFQKLGGELLTSEEAAQRDALIRRVNLQGYRQTMEEAAYTWFNRLIALRYMQEHQLLPVSQRVLPEMPGQMPEIIREAHQLSLDGVDSVLVLDLLDRNDNTTLYRYLLISLCNALHEPLPMMFEKISDYTELLFPDGLLKDDSVLAALAKIPAEDFQDIQVIGWLYQYYNTELKNETFELLKKNVKITKERIGAATQLFTPEWIVRYMVQNSLGRLWLEGHPEESLRMKWRYYMDEAQQEPEVAAKLAEIRQGYASMQLEDIKLLDPCMGSGHILVYAFDMLMEIYRTMGYTDRDAVRSIVENNLYGLDIDDRAAQLAYFAVMMKACEYDRRFLRRGIQPHVCAMQESTGMPQDAWSYFSGQQNTAQELYRAFEHAKDYGSLIAPDVTLTDLTLLESQMEEMARHAEYADLITQALVRTALAAMQPLLAQARTLVQRYDVVVTNPPYMGSGSMNDRLSTYVKDMYLDSKGDMSTVFMQRCLGMCTEHGFMAMINIPVWMFLPSYERLRAGIIDNNSIINMVHPGRGIFGSDFGTTSFVIAKVHLPHYRGTYRRLFDNQGEVESNDVREKQFLSNKGEYIASQAAYKKIPCVPIAYWVTPEAVSAYSRAQLMSEVGQSTKGIITGDNNRYMRLWWEIVTSRIKFDSTSNLDAYQSRMKWFPCTKGGDFRKWYGNKEYIMDWENNGYRIINDAKEEKRHSQDYYHHLKFKRGISWSVLTASTRSFRLEEQNLIEHVGMAIFAHNENDTLPVLGFMNSATCAYYLTFLSPTVAVNAGEIGRLPYLECADRYDILNSLVQNCVSISKLDWDSFENSWDFKKHPLI